MPRSVCHPCSVAGLVNHPAASRIADGDTTATQHLLQHLRLLCARLLLLRARCCRCLLLRSHTRFGALLALQQLSADALSGARPQPAQEQG